jgi:hypothetical protein
MLGGYKEISFPIEVAEMRCEPLGFVVSPAYLEYIYG